ncbi:MAG: prepilin-type N-terminal cleavage/methylation domain-containing protein, partial [Deltaproteobacteria bacterium]|nr:prepilin-type N-terminal cleavage/methylation domain-containing protein [Deltaproteobacteria bacterium]
MTKNSKGFSLIEMAVVMVIVGIVISIVASVIPSLIQSAKTKKARAILEKVDYALRGYSMANHRLPFADSNGDGTEDSDIYLGDLPYLTIGLSSGKDAWGNKIKYGVYDDLAATFSNADAFCAAISSASTGNFTDEKVFTTLADLSAGADGNNSSNQAYVIASGGPKDLDGANGFFDLCNGENNPGFNAPNRIQSGTYDDLTMAFPINELSYKNCKGGDSGGSAVEICDNAIDDDGDGDIDCDDSDCVDDPACA